MTVYSTGFVKDHYYARANIRIRRPHDHGPDDGAAGADEVDTGNDLYLPIISTKK